MFTRNKNKGASNEPLMGCKPLPGWLRLQRYVHAIDNSDDNLCVCILLAINKKNVGGKKIKYKKQR